jgi:hypothetical protein
MLNQIPCEGNQWIFNEMKEKTHGHADQSLIPREKYDGLFFIHTTQAPEYIK